MWRKKPLPDGREERERGRDAPRRGKKNWGDAAAASPAPLVWLGDATQVWDFGKGGNEFITLAEKYKFSWLQIHSVTLGVCVTHVSRSK